MKKILQGHGSGGKLMNEMIAETIVTKLGKDSIQLDDAAILDLDASRIAFTTDTFTITPIFFPGGDIGRLAVNGTVNDLAVMGAEPRFLSCALVIEEGLEFAHLEAILESMKAEADSAGVRIVTGDTKVVPRGKADGIFINTSGIGIVTGPPRRKPIKAGDSIIISGTLGDHGMAVMASRHGLVFAEKLESDCMHLNHLIRDISAAAGDAIAFMRDPTRGGAASVLNEIVQGAAFGAVLIEDSVPVRAPVRGACEILGIEPLYVANEGKVMVIADSASADDIVRAMRQRPEGENAAIIGFITDEYPGRALVETPLGARRMLPLLIEEQLPRIC
jgi:hydrogenase expression/formation protein HypE